MREQKRILKHTQGIYNIVKQIEHLDLIETYASWKLLNI